MEPRTDTATVRIGEVRPLLVSAKEAAALLGIGRTTLYELIGEGDLVPVRIGRCVRFRLRELEAFVDRLVSEASGSGHLVDNSPGNSAVSEEGRTRPGRARRVRSADGTSTEPTPLHV